MSKTICISSVSQYIVSLFLLVASAIPVGLKAHSQQEKEKPTIKKQVTASELYEAFRKDNQAATKLYAKKVLEITGVAVYIGPDAYTLPSVELSDKKGSKGKVLCVLPFSDYLKLRKVSKGNKMIMEGEIRGYSQEHDIIVVKQCKIIKNEK